jgi:1,4-dihydroxy-2-naphthoate octaprenyltransferase
LPAALVPVVVGATVIIHHGSGHHLRVLNTVLAAFVALALQIGTNYANDYSDGVRGTDEVRVGPFRLTASKLVAATSVRRAAFLSFGLAAVAGVVLAARTSWWLVPIGVSAVAAGWFYTGGPRPYGYLGFGELFVLIYFGLVATIGTAYVQCSGIPGVVYPEAVACGMAAVALLEANNLRDIEGDQKANKRTLAARLGRQRASWLFLSSLGVLGLGVVGSVVQHRFWWCAIEILIVLRWRYHKAIGLVRDVTKNGRELLPVLPLAASAQLLLGVCLLVVNLTR